MIETLAMILVAGTVAAPAPAPSGAPVSPFITTFGVSPQFWRVNWTNGDATAYTRVYVADLGDVFANAVFQGSTNPGGTSFDTAIEFSILIGSQKTFFVTHRKNGQESSAVSVNTA